MLAELTVLTPPTPPKSFDKSDMCETLKGSEQSQIGDEARMSVPVLPPTFIPNFEPQYLVDINDLGPPKLAPHAPV